MISKMRTGRTTRMIEEAIRLASEGKSVYVIFCSAMQAKTQHDALMEMGIHSEVRMRIVCRSEFSGPVINWDTMQMAFPEKYPDPNSTLLVDHMVIERKFFAILNAWTRFDGEIEKEVPALPALLKRRLKLGAHP